MNNMKSTIKSLAVLALAALSAVSCQKETAQDKESVSGKRIEVSVTGLMGEYQAADATKADLVNTVRVNWVDGDTVYAYTTEGYIGLLLASLDENDGRYAKLSGEIDDPQGKVVTLVHSPLLTDGNKETILVNKKICFDLSKQDGEKVPFVVYGTLDAEELTVTNAIIPFKFATSVAKVNCTGLAEGKDITKASLGGVNTVCELTLSAAGDATVNGTTKSTITRSGENAFKKEDTRAIFQMAVAETAAQQSGVALMYRTLTVIQSDTAAFFVANFAGDKFDTGKAYNSVYAMKDYSYVEIAGTKWARINLGSSSINGYGDLYCFGETAPKEDNSEDKYTLSISGSLTAEQDAATVNLGNAWRMPTADEFANLYKVCLAKEECPEEHNPTVISADAIDENGKVKKGVYLLAANQQFLKDIPELMDISAAGLLFSDSDSYLFLPFAGCSMGKSRENYGSDCSYWTCTMYGADAVATEYESFYTLLFPIYLTFPNCTGSIRPVISE